MSGRMESRYVPGTRGAITENWNHATWFGPTQGAGWTATRL